MEEDKLVHSLIASVLVHLGVFFVIFLGINPHSFVPLANPPQLEPKQIRLNSIEIVETPRAPSPGISKSSQHLGAFHLKKLGVFGARSGLHLTSRALSPRGMQSSGQNSSGQNSKDANGYDFANSITLQEESELFPFFQAIWQKIEAHTRYPDAFARERIEGSVTVQLVVNSEGVFTGKIIESKSNSPLLETYLIAILIHALRAPLPPHLRTQRGDMPLVTHFKFETFSVGGTAEVNPSEHSHDRLKNILYFTRKTYVEPKLKEQIEKFVTTYLPPVIPVVGGFSIDFYRAYQLIQNYKNRHKTTEGDRNRIDIELMKDSWDQMIHEHP